MSQVLWCDPGGHAFTANDPEHKTYLDVAELPDGARRERMDVCGPCRKSGNLFRPLLGIASSDANGPEDAQTRPDDAQTSG